MVLLFIITRSFNFYTSLELYIIIYIKYSYLAIILNSVYLIFIFCYELREHSDPDKKRFNN